MKVWLLLAAFILLLFLVLPQSKAIYLLVLALAVGTARYFYHKLRNRHK